MYKVKYRKTSSLKIVGYLFIYKHLYLILWIKKNNKNLTSYRLRDKKQKQSDNYRLTLMLILKTYLICVINIFGKFYVTGIENIIHLA